MKVNLTIETKKLRADSLGNETEIPIHDWIPIGVFGKTNEGTKGNNKPLYLKKHKIDKPKQTIHIVVHDIPVEAGIDPYCLLIDRIWDNNMIKVEKLEY